MIVLEEEDRRRAEVGAVDRDDLRAGRALEHGLVVAANTSARAVEAAAIFSASGEPPDARRPARADPSRRDRRWRPRRAAQSQRAPQQPVAHAVGKNFMASWPPAQEKKKIRRRSGRESAAGKVVSSHGWQRAAPFLPASAS